MAKLKFQSTGDGRYLLFDSKICYITYNGFSEVEQFLTKAQKTFLKTKTIDGRPIWIDYMTTIREIITGYQSQLNRQQRRKLAREENKYFKKAETNRMKNQKSNKKIDNIRYLLARAARISSVNFFPAGFYSKDGIINFLDRGNVSEEQSQTLKSDGGLAFKKDYYKKAISEIIETLGDDTPIVVLDWKAKIEKLDSSKEYTLFEIIGQDGIDSILNEVVNIKVMVSTEVQAVSEMVNFNGKNNPWVFLHFMFQYLDIRNNFDNDAIFSVLSKKGKYLNIKDYIGYKENETDVPEILPALPTITTIVSKVISKFDWQKSNDDEKREFKDKLKQAYIAFDSYKSTNQDKVKVFYDTFLSKTQDLSKLHTDIEKCANVLDKIIGDKWWEGVTEIWDNLLIAIEHILNDTNQTDIKITDAKTYVKARFSDVIKNDMQDLINTIAISMHDAKFTLHDTSYSNIELFFESLKNELISGIEIIKNKSKDIIDYKVSNDDVKNLLTSQRAASFDKKLELIYPFIERAIIKTQNEIGKDTNYELKQKEISLLKQITVVEKNCWWMESDTKGNMVKIGLSNGIITPDSSWQHLIDSSNDWENGCLECLDTNAGKGRSIKQPKLFEYKRKLEDVENFFNKKLITKQQFDFSKLSLETIISNL
jgi:hypothetical protein